MTIQQIVPRAKALVGLKRPATDRQPSPEDLQAVLLPISALPCFCSTRATSRPGRFTQPWESRLL